MSPVTVSDLAFHLRHPHQKLSIVNYAAFSRIKSLINNVTSDPTNLAAFIEATNCVRRCYLEVVMRGSNGVEIFVNVD